MSLDVSKLEDAVQSRKDGEDVIIARCPACAEDGGDNTGNHLIIFPDGKFGCVVNPAEDLESKEHRRRIFELVGSKDRVDKLPAKSAFKPKVKMLSVPKRTRIIHLQNRPIPEE